LREPQESKRPLRQMSGDRGSVMEGKPISMATGIGGREAEMGELRLETEQTNCRATDRLVVASGMAVAGAAAGAEAGRAAAGAAGCGGGG